MDSSEHTFLPLRIVEGSVEGFSYSGGASKIRGLDASFAAYDDCPEYITTPSFTLLDKPQEVDTERRMELVTKLLDWYWSTCRKEPQQYARRSL
jgi:hypothetical protein